MQNVKTFLFYLIVIQHYPFNLGLIVLIKTNILNQSPRFKNLDSSRNCLNPTLRPNSDDSLCHVIDGCKIFGSTQGVRPNENKTDCGWF